MMRFRNMHGLGEHSVETVEVILYELKPNSQKTAEVICQDVGGYMPRRRRLYANLYISDPDFSCGLTNGLTN